MVEIELIKQLREETDVSLAECKKALEEAGGDIEKAKEVLRKRGRELAEKKQDRETHEGLVEAYTHGNGKIGVLVELRCETDFVAKAEAFKGLAHEIALQISATNPETVEDLLSQEYIRDEGKKVADLVSDAVAKLGEKIVVSQFTRFQI